MFILENPTAEHFEIWQRSLVALGFEPEAREVAQHLCSIILETKKHPTIPELADAMKWKTKRAGRAIRDLSHGGTLEIRDRSGRFYVFIVRERLADQWLCERFSVKNVAISLGITEREAQLALNDLMLNGEFSTTGQSGKLILWCASESSRNNLPGEQAAAPRSPSPSSA